MRPITVLRAIAWLALVAAMWSLSNTWGGNAADGKGPPAEWEREVAGGLILIGLAALLLSISSAKGRRQRWLTRGFAAAASSAAVFIALSLRSTALSSSFPELIAGGGWTAFAVGAGISLAASVTALLLPSQKVKVAVGSKKARRRRS